jgi:hypothetical protein
VKNLKLHQRRLRAGSLAFSPLVEATAFRGGGVFTLFVPFVFFVGKKNSFQTASKQIRHFSLICLISYCLVPFLLTETVKFSFIAEEFFF